MADIWSPNNPGISGLKELTSAEVATVQQIAALGDPNANRILGWDDTDNAYKYFTIGSGLSYDHTTHTLSSSGGGSPSIGGTLTSATAGSVLFAGSGTFAQDNAQFFWDDTNHWLGIGTAVPTNSLTVGSTGNGIALYNTSDQVTNFEKTVINYSSNIFGITTTAGGTGLARPIVISAGASVLTLQAQALSPKTSLTWGSTGQALGFNVTGTLSATSSQVAMSINPILNQSSTAGYTAFLINPTETTVGSGNKYLTDWQIGGSSFVSMTNTGLLDFHSTTNSTAGGLVFHNQTDEVTNFEKGTLGWSSNNFTLSTAKGGTGTNRNLILMSGTRSLTILDVGAATTNFAFASSATYNSTGGAFVAVNYTTTQTSNTNTALSISPTINQSSTAGYTGLLINPTETATGSGAKNLILAQVGGSTKFSVSNVGIGTLTNATDQQTNTVLVLQSLRATPAASDRADLLFQLNNSSSSATTFAAIETVISTVTAGGETGFLDFLTTSAGSTAARMRLEATNLHPLSNDQLALGSSTASWSDLYLASGGVINWANGNYTLTHSTGLLTVSGDVQNGGTAGTTTASMTTNGGTQTLTNKRITPRIGSTVSSTTPTPVGDSNDLYEVTALGANATVGTPGGTPVDGQKIIIRIKDDGTARTLSFNAIYRASSDLALPTTTIISKTMYLGFLYNSADSKWDFVAFLNNF